MDVISGNKCRAFSSSPSRSHRRYRMKAPTSQVDTWGVGTASQTPADYAEQPPNAKKRETIQIITRDLIRRVAVPRKETLVHTTVLSPAAFDVMMRRCGEAEAPDGAERAQEKLRSARWMKQKLNEADLQREKKQPVPDTDARKREQFVLKHGGKLEDEDEVKKLNSRILEAQCWEARRAQIREKGRIEAQRAKEERRLDAMMEVQRQQLVEKMGDLWDQRKKQRLNEMEIIVQQIQERQLEKQVQQDVVEQEKCAYRQMHEKMKLEDRRVQEQKREEQRRLHREVLRINEENLKRQEKLKKEEELAELREEEFLKMKLQREVERKEEQRRIQKEKEMGISMLMTRQEKVLDRKAEQDEIRARKDRFLKERELRIKEKELAKKKKEEVEMLKVARREQIRCKELIVGEEAERDKARLDRVLKVQREELEKFNRMKEKQRQEALRYSEALRRQIADIDRCAAAEHKKHLIDLNKQREEEHLRRAILDEHKGKKIQALRASGIAEELCRYVERKTVKDVLSCRG